MIFLKERTKRASGSTVVGFALAFPILILAILALVDFSQMLAARSYAQWVASEVLKSAQGSPALRADIWRLTADMADSFCDLPGVSGEEKKYCDFLEARSRIAQEAAQRLTSVYGSQISMETFTFYDRTSGAGNTPTITRHDGLAAAILLPGTSAVYAGGNLNHKHLCARPMDDPYNCVTTPSGLTCARLFEDCSNPIDHTSEDHKLDKLLKLYPIELHMAFKVKTILLPARYTTIAVAGYPVSAVSSAPVPTPTATPTATATATATSTQPPATATSTPSATATNTPIGPTSTSTATATATPIVPTSTSTSTATSTPIIPTSTATSTATNTPIVPTSTSTPTSTATPIVPTSTSTATSTATPIVPTSTSTATSTATNTPVPPTSTATPTSTSTPIPPTSTSTPTRTSTNTPVPPTSTATPTSTPTSTATSTPIPPTPTYTATPTATPTCSYYNYAIVSRTGGVTNDPRYEFTGTVPSCIADTTAACKPYGTQPTRPDGCPDLAVATTPTDTEKCAAWRDWLWRRNLACAMHDEVCYASFKVGDPEPVRPNGCPAFVNDGVFWQRCTVWRQWLYARNAFMACMDAYFGYPVSQTAPHYLTRDCQLSTNPPNGTSCGSINVNLWHVSPVSLLIGSTELKEPVTYTRFPLDPSLKGKWFSWRASESAPLLVYDPKRTGKIVDGTALFGTSTFGRKWENGFAALKSLNRDGDGKLSGGELDALALWFDRDRDGTPGDGEVVPLREYGIVSLFFEPDRSDGKSGELYASRGYERIVGGKLTTGASVDWFSKDYESAQGQTHDAETNVEPEVSARAGLDQVFGYWLWRNKGAERVTRAGGGLLYLKQEGDRLIGTSLVEADVAPNKQGIIAAIVPIPVTGTVTEEPSGAITIAFEALDPKGDRTKSRATLSADGTELRGVSTLETARDSRTGQALSRSYEWVGRRGPN